MDAPNLLLDTPLCVFGRITAFTRVSDLYTLMYVYNRELWDRLRSLNWEAVRKSRKRQLCAGIESLWTTLCFEIFSGMGDVSMQFTMDPYDVAAPFRCTLYHRTCCTPKIKCIGKLTGATSDFTQTITLTHNNGHAPTQIGLYYDRSHNRFGIVQIHNERRLYFLPIKQWTEVPQTQCAIV